MLLDELGRDPHVAEPQARHFGEVGVRLRVEARRHDVEDADAALLAGTALEQLLLAGADGPLGQLALNDGEPFLDLPEVRRGAVAAK